MKMATKGPFFSSLNVSITKHAVWRFCTTKVKASTSRGAHASSMTCFLFLHTTASISGKDSLNLDPAIFFYGMF